MEVPTWNLLTALCWVHWAGSHNHCKKELDFLTCSCPVAKATSWPLGRRWILFLKVFCHFQKVEMNLQGHTPIGIKICISVAGGICNIINGSWPIIFSLIFTFMPVAAIPNNTTLTQLSTLSSCSAPQHHSSSCKNRSICKQQAKSLSCLKETCNG